MFAFKKDDTKTVSKRIMDQLNILGLITKWNRQGKKDGKGGRKEDKERSNPATFSHLVVVVIVMLGMVMVLVVMVMVMLVVILWG